MAWEASASGSDMQGAGPTELGGAVSTAMHGPAMHAHAGKRCARCSPSGSEPIQFSGCRSGWLAADRGTLRRHVLVQPPELGLVDLSVAVFVGLRQTNKQTQGAARAGLLGLNRSKACPALSWHSAYRSEDEKEMEEETGREGCGGAPEAEARRCARHPTGSL